MAVLFWYLSKSVFPSFRCIRDIIEFLYAILRVGVCWFQKHIHICPYIKRIALVPLTAGLTLDLPLPNVQAASPDRKSYS